MSNETLFLSCTPGVEAALSDELQSLGFVGKQERGGVTVVAPVFSYEVLNLWSRCASRILLRVALVDHPSKLARVSFASWGRIRSIDVVGQFGRVWREAASRAWGSIDETRGSVDVQLRVDSGTCTVSVDTSGDLLYLRGYRQEIGRAPLRETLAASLLRLANWRPGEALWDIMCGSGTIVIEAAEQAMGLAPGRNRHFAFEKLSCFDAARFASIDRVREVQTRAKIWGSDVNAGALGVARRNAKRANVTEATDFERRDATQIDAKLGVASGLLISNLPYGQRVGVRDELSNLYRGVGATLRRSFGGWRFAFLAENGIEHLGLSVENKFPVENGGIRCQFVVGHIPPKGV